MSIESDRELNRSPSVTHELNILGYLTSKNRNSHTDSSWLIMYLGPV